MSDRRLDHYSHAIVVEVGAKDNRLHAYAQGRRVIQIEK
jgi:hypothetical protein